MQIESAPVHPATDQDACRICGGPASQRFSVREMMYGTRETFDYFECTTCGCLQIAEYPPNIAAYYPDDYYSFQMEPSNAETGSLAANTKEWVIWQVLRHAPALARRYFATSSARQFLTRHPLVTLYRRYVPDLGARILDVGCGTGAFVRTLRVARYFRAVGLDPFITDPVHQGGRLLVQKGWLSDLQGTFDCISFHHVLEHMPDQQGSLRRTREHLAPNGVVIIRVPAAGGEAWQRYRENWQQLDAPRHFYLHTERSLAALAEQTGFEIAELEYDSSSLLFWGSELYLRDIPLHDPRSPHTPGPSIFTDEEMARFARDAAELNRLRRGDQFRAVLIPR